MLHPGTHEPVGPDDLAPLFPMDLILQEVAEDRFIEIPEEILEVYQAFFNGELEDYEHPQERIDAAMTRVPVVSG